MSADLNWTPAMSRQDISDQVSEHNAAMADETYDRNNWDHDDQPTRAEIERDNWDDWLWWRNGGNA